MGRDDDLYKREAIVALSAISQRVRWKPGKAVAHLEKRKKLGHVPVKFSIERYNRLIQTLVRVGEHRVYLYRFGSERYYAVTGAARGAEWLAILSKEGIMETAFPPDSLASYLSQRGFVFLGTIGEILG